MSEIKWRKSIKHGDKVESEAYMDKYDEVNDFRIFGYNGIALGDKVKYKNKQYIVVMVGRTTPYFGLSENGKMPYKVVVGVDEISKLK